MASSAITAVIAALIATQQQPAPPVPSERTTLTDSVLARDAWTMILRSEAMIAMMQKSGDAACQRRKLSRTRVVLFPQQARRNDDGTIRDGTWKEEWVVDRCGKLFAYTIQFTAMRGGTQIGVEQPFNPAPVPR